MLAVVLQTIEVLVALETRIAAVWLLLFHADGAGVWDRCGGVDNGEGAVRVLLELLVLVTVL